MVFNPDRDGRVTHALHYNRDAYWCAGCWSFTLDCAHLADPLDTRIVALNDWLLTGVRYDQEHRILETHMNNGEASQYAGVSLQLALMLVRSTGAGKFYEERITGKFPSSRARISQRVRDGLPPASTPGS